MNEQKYKKIAHENIMNLCVTPHTAEQETTWISFCVVLESYVVAEVQFIYLSFYEIRIHL